LALFLEDGCAWATGVSDQYWRETQKLKVRSEKKRVNKKFPREKERSWGNVAREVRGQRWRLKKKKKEEGGTGSA